MIAVIQRVKESSVSVKQEIVGKIGPGMMVLLGVCLEDTEEDADYLCEKMVHLRIFPDQNNKMNLSLADTGGDILLVSQFTLAGDTRKGRRPSYVRAAPPDLANELYEYTKEKLVQMGIHVETGRFGEMMDVFLVNDGPVTLIVDSRSRKNQTQ